MITFMQDAYVVIMHCHVATISQHLHALLYVFMHSPQQWYLAEAHRQCCCFGIALQHGCQQGLSAGTKP
jgi:hypothetical protein